MKYEDAVKKWGEKQLGYAHVEYDEVLDVSFDMDPGYQCCGGRDPDCYCSFAESASLQADIRFRRKGEVVSRTYTVRHIDMGETIKEVVEME